MTRKARVVVQLWHYGPGWKELSSSLGGQPDGFSIHLTNDCRLGFIDREWLNQKPVGSIDCSFPVGYAYFAEIDDDLARELSKQELGLGFTSIRCRDRHAPAVLIHCGE